MMTGQAAQPDTRRLIVNADDFGQSAGINEGIIRCHERGIVTSASLMVRWPHAAAAAEYARTLAGVFETRRGELPRFDLVLLGMGLDGHTASLFPGSPALKEVFRPVVAVHATAAVHSQRLTLTLPTLNAAARIIFLVSGAEKAKAVKAMLRDGTVLPAAMVRPADGTLTWIVDRAAASLLPPDRLAHSPR